jgi:hypothetical protein
MAPALPRQPDLLDWRPPEPVAAFPPERVRGASFAARLSRAVSQALADCGASRDAVAERMSAFLGQRVSKAMLDAYASPSRADHGIGAERLMALVHATGDRRLLELLAEPMGWTVIERRYLPLIQLAAVREREDELRRAAELLRREARQGRLL